MSIAPGVATLPRPRDATGEFGIYVHVPFCVHRCWYCDFNAYAGLDDLAPAYMDALARDAGEALSAPEDADLDVRPVVTSVFVGGGTPSHVQARLLVRVLDAIRASWDVAPGVEITVECNPESVDAEKVDAYLAAGVTRLSFGVQSLDDRLLGSLGRTHDAATAVRAAAIARACGAEDLNLDLIFGVPGEDDAVWRDTLAGVLALEPAHLSCYGLTYEDGTPLEAWRRLGKVVPVPDDDVARRWEIADATLATAGFERYEISNWARIGRACRHNRLYWSCGEYLGIGAGAHGHLASCDGSVRSWTVRSPERYTREVAAGVGTVAGSERVGPAERASEAMFLGLRRVEGVAASAFRALTGADLEETFGARLREQAARGLLTWDGDRARLTGRGTLLANEAVAAFLA